jgi:hypothetical protein
MRFVGFGDVNLVFLVILSELKIQFVIKTFTNRIFFLLITCVLCWPLPTKARILCLDSM